MPLKAFRNKLDRIDDKIIKLLEKRMAIAKEVGEFKLKNDIQIYQQGREGEIKDKLKKFAATHELSYEFISDLWDRIMSESIKIQEDVFDKNK